MRVEEKKLVILEIGEGFFYRLQKQQEKASIQKLNRWEWKEADDLFIRCCVMHPDGSVSIEFFRSDPTGTKNSDQNMITSLVVNASELKDLEELICEQCKKIRADASDGEADELPPLKTFDRDNIEIRIVADRTCEYAKY